MELNTHTDFLHARGLLGLTQSKAASICGVQLYELQRVEHHTFGPEKVEAEVVDKIKSAYDPIVTTRMNQIAQSKKDKEKAEKSARDKKKKAIDDHNAATAKKQD